MLHFHMFSFNVERKCFRSAVHSALIVYWGVQLLLTYILYFQIPQIGQVTGFETGDGPGLKRPKLEGNVLLKRHVSFK